MKKQKNVPELRFPEFEGDWTYTVLRKITKYTKGFAFRSEDYIEEGTRIIRVSDLDEQHINQKNQKVYISKNLAESDKIIRYKIYKGNIIITTVGSKPELRASAVGRGIYVVNDNEGFLNQNLLKFENIEGINNRFLFNYINSPRYISYIISIQRGNANQSNITVEDLLNYPIHVTTLEEQEKIASFLSAVDKKLTQLRRKKELLETYKRGLMQKLFSQQIRFKQDDGTAFPDWQEKSLGELGEFKNGFNADKQSFGSGIEFVNLMDIFGKNEITKTFFERVQIPQKQLEQYKIKKGDVLFVRSSVKRSGVGQSCLVNDDFEDTVYSGFIIRFREKYNDLIHFYKKYCFSSLEFRENILSVATSSANTNINQESLVNILLCYPCKEEQQKIADCLTALDKKIEAVAKQIHHTEQFKKGLLQKMFV